MNPEKASGSHLTMNVLVRAADGELPEAEMLSMRKHLSVCPQCGLLFKQIEDLSGQVEGLVASVPVADSFADRQQLVRSLERPALVPPSNSESADQHARLILRRFGWSMAIAASLALGIIVAPHTSKTTAVTSHSVAAETSGLEVDGESFIPLPYSNPDLPVNTSRVVEMQVPVSSLTSAGLVFEPVAAGYRTADQTVLADVLIGTDGQPLGVHILGVE